MAIVKDIIGLKFGKLTILGVSNERGNKNQIVRMVGNYITIP